MDDFLISITHEGSSARITCRGELDVSTSQMLREGFSVALDLEPRTVVLVASNVTFISAAGITALVDMVVRCKEAGVVLDLRLSDHIRRVLDMVGLWWLGVVDDGVAIHLALQTALRVYAEQQAGEPPTPLRGSREYERPA